MKFVDEVLDGLRADNQKIKTAARKFLAQLGATKEAWIELADAVGVEDPREWCSQCGEPVAGHHACTNPHTSEAADD